MGGVGEAQPPLEFLDRTVSLNKGYIGGVPKPHLKLFDGLWAHDAVDGKPVTRLIHMLLKGLDGGGAGRVAPFPAKRSTFMAGSPI